MTLPFAMIGPELARAGSVGSSTLVSQTSSPVRASSAYIMLSPLASISVVPQIARLRFVPPRTPSGYARLYSQWSSPVFASNA
jgi:hypothetical protein